jgi:hypothetical protein
MPTYKETADDLNKKFHNSYALYRGRLAYLSHFQSHPNGSIVAMIQYDENKSEMTEIDPDSFSLIPVPSMFVNTHDLTSNDSLIPATQVWRYPRRQWKRGINGDNTSTRCPMKALYSAIGKSFSGSIWDRSISFNLVRRIMDPQYPTLSQALGHLEKFQAVAIAPMFAVCLSNVSSDWALLTSLFGFIGEVRDKTIIVRHRPALQEVRDYVSRTNQQITVDYAS